jgi:nucleoside-diphosphate-sugar epimerase
MSRVLVTGASGFVGAHCLPLLVAKGHQVHAVSRRRPSAGICRGVSWHEQDLLVPGGPSKVIQQVKPEMVLHLAWCAAPGLFWETPENLGWVRASIELMQAFVEKGGRRFVGAGSCAEYGRNLGQCTEDSTPLRPATPYGTCKNAFAQVLFSMSSAVQLSAAWGRIFFLYGPHEHPSRLVAYVIRSLLQAEHADCSEGHDILDFIHISDAAAAFIALLESPVEGAVNIASGRPIAVRQILEEIARQIERPELLRLGARQSHLEPWKLWADVRRLTKEVGFVPRYDLRDGIRQTIDWSKNSAATPA